MGLSEEIKLQETVKWSWSWQKVRKPMIIGLGGGILIGLGVWLSRDLLNLFYIKPINALIYGLFLGVIVGIIIGFINVFTTYDIDIYTKKYPNQGVRNSRKNAAIALLIVLPITIFINELLFMIPGNPPLPPLSPLLGLVGLYAGGLACVQHFTLRIICWCNGYISWNYYNFLEYATEGRFLRRVGGRYRFVHNLLQEHFAALQLSPQGLNASNNFRIKGIIVIFTCVIFSMSALFLPFILPDSIRIGSLTWMMTTIKKNDLLFVNKIRENYRIYQRGDIVPFKTTEKMRQKGFKFPVYLKRIVGLPGETFEVNKGQVYINGKLLLEDYIDVPGTYEYKSVQVPADSYFLLGDNRNYNGSDLGGLVPQDHIRGQVIFRYWPPNRMGNIN